MSYGWLLHSIARARYILVEIIYSSSDAMTRVCAVEELPRGDRKLVRALGKSVLMFWYRDTVFAIESRSPAEGAYSEGFEKARLTQDACIECPTTKSKFDLKTGAIKEWYPENPVLKALTPQDTCRPMEVFSVEVRDDGIYLDAKNGSLGPNFVAPIGLGGANTSLENNNVFAVETPMYVDGEEGAKSVSSGDGAAKMDAGQLGGLVAIAGVLAVGGTGACLYYENTCARRSVGHRLRGRRRCRVENHRRSRRRIDYFY